ncbi:ATP-binding protein (plasmid) [Embleya sp. NBC_00888]|uniref:ATP-binding protein n=1 Tax=Embleya sp. NBC_00888 TaxID=2975960 RepID=UPI002F90719B|nr:ATP-binding protein [Embleya sp. NBC_00888]
MPAIRIPENRAPAPPAAARRSRHHSRSLPNDRRAPGDLRAWISAHLARWGLGRLDEDLCLIATELATNAIRHGETPALATLSLGAHDTDGPYVRLEITDHGPGFDHARVRRGWEAPEHNGSNHGRGLLLVDALSTTWGAVALHPGQRVWAQLAIPWH